MRRFVVIHWLIAILLGSALLPAQNLRRSEAEKSILQLGVNKPDGTFAAQGTGFFVGPEGMIATAFHVYAQLVVARGENRGGTMGARRYIHIAGPPGMLQWAAGRVELIASDEPHDLALLRIIKIDQKAWSTVGGSKALIPTTVTEVEPGTNVKVLGYFGADLLPVTLGAHLVGETQFLVAPANDIWEFLVSASAVPGQSGSPVLLEDGSLLGVMLSIVTTAIPFNNQPLPSGLNRVAKVEHLQRLLLSVPKT